MYTCHRVGHDVSLLARGENLSAIRANSLTLIEPDGSRLTAPGLRMSDAVGELGGQDLVILAVKAHQLVDIAGELPLLYDAETVVMPLQNGIPWWFFQRFDGPFAGYRLASLDPDGTLERCIPSDRIVGSIAYPAVERESPGVIRRIEGDRFPVGELDGDRSARSATISRALTEAGFKSRVVTDIRSQVWVKAWGNLAFNPITALTGATLDAICAFAPSRDLAAQIMLEATAIAEQLGLRLRVTVEQRIAGAASVGSHKTSMLQDLEAGRPLEVEALVGSFVEFARD